MAKVEVVMPKMGESIQEGKILTWLKKEGDKVERDEILLEISTDKVDTEVPSPQSGIVTKIYFPVGETVEVGKLIAEIETDVTAASAAPAAPAPAVPAPPPPVQAAAAAPPVPTSSPTSPAAPASGGALIDVVMPKMGESIQEGKILNWLKKEGEKIERDEILLEISTDKVDTEVPSPTSGVIAKLLFNVGDTVEVGKVIAQISSGASAASAPAAAPPPAPASIPVPAAAAPVVLPTPPAPVYTPAPVAAPVASPVYAANGGAVGRGSEKRFYSPLVRTIAQTEGVSAAELETIAGTGLEGRVTKHDILGYLEARKSGRVTVPAAAPAVAPVAAPQPVVSVPSPAPSAVPAAPAPPPIVAPVVTPGDEQIVKKYGQHIEIIPMDRVRERIAEHMVMSVRTSPHVTLIAEADVTGMVRLREKQKKAFEAREGTKLTFTPFIIQAIVEGVKKFPMVNVSVEGTKIVRHRRVNVGMGTALPDGNLIVPVLKDADTQNLTGLARMVNDLATRARSKKLSPDDIAGGTITLTNFGTFNLLTGTPIINQPQTCIVGAGAIEKRPVVRELDGQDVVVIRSMMYVSATVDHRVIDGMLGGQFLQAVVQALESINEETVKL
jgi:2-oxoglutarate dehydrogenase E2 component (dihydrolipoamide succinyltransferase)